MILEEFISKLAARIPESSWHSTSGGVVFPAISEQFGDIEVASGENELIIHFGNFTHGHFNSADSAISCLMEVFNDQMEFYGNSRGGGSCPKGKRGTISKWFFGETSYVWSGAGG